MSLSSLKTLRILSLVMALCLIGLSASTVLAEFKPLPIDLSGGRMPLASGYSSESRYEDPTITASFTKGKHRYTDTYVARVTIKDPSQLRTLSAAGFDENAVMPALALAKRVNAVMAINGDYFSFINTGHLVRQGVTYRQLADGKRDVLVIDDKGDFHALYGLKSEDAAEQLKDIKVINSFNFGPILVDKGEVNKKMLAPSMAVGGGRQRMAIAQTGPLSYLIVCCGGPSGGSKGMTLYEFADFVAAQDDNILVAYNLDGGDSTSLLFDGKQVNDLTAKFTREISDIIYFASAWEE